MLRQLVNNLLRDWRRARRKRWDIKVERLKDKLEAIEHNLDIATALHWTFTIDRLFRRREKLVKKLITLYRKENRSSEAGKVRVKYDFWDIV